MSQPLPPTRRASTLQRTITQKKDTPVYIFVSAAFGESYIEFIEDYGITVRVVLDVESICKVAATFDRTLVGTHEKTYFTTSRKQSLSVRWMKIRNWIEEKLGV